MFSISLFGILLLLAVWILWVILLSSQSFSLSIRERLVYATLYFCFQTLLFVELLSLFKSINSFSFLAIWLSSFFIQLVILFYLIKSKQIVLQYFVWSKNEITNDNLFAAIVIAFYSTILFLIAIIYPPSNWDSMTYHLPRVMHWIQNGNVAHYTTNIIWQNYQPPFAEYLILNNVLCIGHINAANLVQFTAYLGSIVIVSLIIKTLGGEKKIQYFGAALAATVPMAVLQATSTQNDLLLSFFMLIVFYKVFSTNKYWKLFDFIILGISIGLAIITKGTSFLILMPVGVYFIFSCVKKGLFYQNIVRLTFTAVLIIGISFPHYYRNYNEYGHPLGTEVDQVTHKSEYYSLRATVSQIVKNYALNLATPQYGLNDDVNFIVNKIHELIEFDINDSKVSRTGWSDSIFKSNPKSQFYHEDYAPNLLVFCFFLIIIFPLVKYRKKASLQFIFLIITTLSFIMVCCMLKWSPWHTRYHVINALLWVPLIVYVLRKNQTFLILVLGLSVLFSIKHLLERPSKQIFPLSKVFTKKQTDILFSNRISIQSDYEKVMADLKRYNTNSIGLTIGIDDWEFPVWYLASKNNLRLNIHHVISNTKPCVPTDIVISTSKKDSLIFGDLVFKKQSQYSELNIFTLKK